MVESLNRDEVQVLLDAPDPTTAAGVPDRAMLHLTYAAGLRVSELIGLMYTDLARPHLDTVRVTGKGPRDSNPRRVDFNPPDQCAAWRTL